MIEPTLIDDCPDCLIEYQEKVRREVEIEMAPGSVWLERQMAGDGQSSETGCGDWCQAGCCGCRDRWVI